nr:Ras- protein Rab-11A [Polyrhizophydium stewartii]
MDDTLIIKVMVLGDSCVGKSQLVHRFVRRCINDSPRPTAGIDFGTTTFKVDQAATPVKVQIVDNSGHERFKDIIKSYWKLATAALLVYDITNRDSFANVQTWADSFYERTAIGGFEPAVMVVGNMLDRDSKGQRQVPREDGQQFAASHGFLFMETSAIDNTNVDEAFQVLLTDAYYVAVRQRNPTPARPALRIDPARDVSSGASALSPMSTASAPEFGRGRSRSIGDVGLAGLTLTSAPAPAPASASDRGRSIERGQSLPNAGIAARLAAPPGGSPALSHSDDDASSGGHSQRSFVESAVNSLGTIIGGIVDATSSLTAQPISDDLRQTTTRKYAEQDREMLRQQELARQQQLLQQQQQAAGPSLLDVAADALDWIFATEASAAAVQAQAQAAQPDPVGEQQLLQPDGPRVTPKRTVSLRRAVRTPVSPPGSAAGSEVESPGKRGSMAASVASAADSGVQSLASGSPLETEPPQELPVIAE